MIKIGDVLEAKPHFLVRHNIDYEHRFLKVLFIGGEFWEIDNGNNFQYSGSVVLDDFYIPTEVNREILKIINEVSIKEFNAVTSDGKIINFKCTR